MKITITRAEDIDIDLPEYWSSGWAFYKLLKNGKAMRVSHISISCAMTPDKDDVETLRAITRQEFEAAYTKTEQRIREEYLS